MKFDFKRRRWAFVATILGGVFLAACVIVMLLEKRLLFFPSVYPDGRDWTPRSLAVEDVFFSTDDGQKIHGWYVPCESPRAVVLYCHGNAGNVTHRVDSLRALHERAGVSVLLFDYRGYGRSDGSPSEDGFHADARAARAWLAEREHIDPHDVVLLGRSMGGAVAVELAASDGARKLILESTFTSIPEMADVKLGWFPFKFLLRNRFESIEKISRYNGPLLQSHAEDDHVIPINNGRRLFEAANEPKQFYTIIDGGHNDTLPDEYYEQLVEFLDTPDAT